MPRKGVRNYSPDEDAIILAASDYKRVQELRRLAGLAEERSPAAIATRRQYLREARANPLVPLALSPEILDLLLKEEQYKMCRLMGDILQKAQENARAEAERVEDDIRSQLQKVNALIEVRTVVDTA